MPKMTMTMAMMKELRRSGICSTFTHFSQKTDGAISDYFTLMHDHFRVRGSYDDYWEVVWLIYMWICVRE